MTELHPYLKLASVPMKIEFTLFAIVIGMCCIVAVLFLVTPSQYAAGKPHSRIAQMKEGVDGPARHEGWPLVLGWLYGVLQISLYVGCVLFAVRHRKGPLGLILLAGLLFVLVFAMMVAAYVEYLHAPGGAMPLAFPPPTAWMIYGLWSVPILFTILYVVQFRTWVLSEEDHRRFQEILANSEKTPDTSANS